MHLCAAVFQFHNPNNKKKTMKSKLFSVGLALVAAASLFILSTDSAYADYPYRGAVHGGHVHHRNHIHYGPVYRGGGVNFGSGVGLTIGRGGVGFTFGGGYAPSRFNFQPNIYSPNYRNYRPTYVPNFASPYVVPRYSNGAYRQFYIDPSNYQRNTAPYLYPAPYGTGVDRNEFLRFQQETREQLQQLSDQQRRTNAGQQQLERNQQQLQQAHQRLDREQQSLERELQDIQNLLRR